MKVLNVFLFILMNSVGSMASPLPPVSVSVERVGDMSHFEFTGLKTWEYDLKKNKNILEMSVPKISDENLEKLSKYKGLLVSKIEVNNDTINKTQIKFHLNHEGIENFDYLTQEPSNLVVDLFVTDDKILKNLKAQRVADLKLEEDRRKGALAASSGQKMGVRGKKSLGRGAKRNPAFAEYLFAKDADENQENVSLTNKGNSDSQIDLDVVPDNLFDFSQLSYGEDESLETKVIEAKGNIYLRYPLLTLPNRHLQDLDRFKPEYEIKVSFSDENKQARFLMHLYNRRSYASFIKAKKLFKKTFPTSKYQEILDYAEADVWVRLWKKEGRKEFFDKAMNLYRKQVERFPNSKITERTLIYAGLLAHDEGRYFLSSKLLKRYIDRYGNSPFGNYAKVYLADSLAKMNNFSGAIDTYDEIIKTEEEGPTRESEFRIGDVYFLKQEYRRAERSYASALKKYKQKEEMFPNAWFNMAEAQFILAEYPESLKNYKKFAELYPTHPYSGFALTRIGELIDILHDNKKHAQGFYNESFFRFRKTTGGVIARVRSLSQRFKDMNAKQLKESRKEMHRRESEINLPQVDEFVHFMISDGYYDRGDYKEAANALISYFQKNPKPVNIRKFEKRISRAIAGDIRELILNDQVVKGLSIIESHQKSWLSKSQRVDVQFFRALAHEKMNLPKEAYASYERLLKRLKHLKGSKEERERKVFEYYPSEDSVNLRLAATSYALENYKTADEYLKKIKKINDFKSYEKFDYYHTLSKLAFQSKDYPKALEIIEKTRNIPIKNKEKRDKYYVYLSQIYEKNERWDEAIKILEDYHKTNKNKGEREDVYVVSTLFQLYKDKGITDKAIKIGEELLQDYDKKYDLDKERFYLGNLYYDKKDLKKARVTWKGLTKKSMWEQLAKNKVESQDWQKKTEKSLKRIPAMEKR